MHNIIIATIKEWNIQNYFYLKKKYSKEYTFYLISNNTELTYKNISALNPKYIFFPHWSWYIDDKIFTNYECIVFHETDLPFGRGGSPLQNLIQREIYNTKISALKVTKELDAGDIYLKEDFDLTHGSAQELFFQISQIIFEKMIPSILEENIRPIPQLGEITTFKRRTPKQSDILSLNNKTLKGIYDFIRMLDAEGYPKAYLQLDSSKITFSAICNSQNRITGKFEVIENE